MARKLIAGNWKMNGLRQSGGALGTALAARASAAGSLGWDPLVCPPAILLGPVGEALQGSAIELGAQDCHQAQSGAHTGDVSAEMLADAGCRYVIVGHSERRADHGEDDALVRAKAEAAAAAGLTPIVCVGETAAQRGAGAALAVIEAQLTGSLPRTVDGPGEVTDVVIAYEPVWAIGTGQTATPADVAQVHGHIRGLLARLLGGTEAAKIVRLLYGGSVKPGNAAELLAVAEVDGALVGGASLEAEDFWAIGEAAPQ
jgi:triosephosphate isomerase